MRSEVTVVTTPPTPAAVIAQATTWEEFPALWSGLLGEVWAFLRGSDLSPGRNVMLYKDDVPNVEVGVEVAGPFAPHDRVVPSLLPAGRAARTVSGGAPSVEGLSPPITPSVAGAPTTASCSQGSDGRSTAIGGTIPSGSRPRSTGC